MKPLKALLVEDSEMDEELLLRQLAKADYDVQSIRVQTAADLENALAERDWDIVLSDFAMPGFTGLDALRVLQKSGQDIPLIIISGTIGEDVAVEAMRVGVNDYLLKGNLTRLAPAIKRELENAAIRRAQKQAEEALRQSEASLANAQRIAHIGNWDWDIQNNHFYWSEEIYRIFGRAHSEFGGTYEAFFETVHPDDRQKVQAAVDATLTRNALHNYEHRIIRPDGEERVVCEIGEATFDESGKPLRFIGTVQDITERKAADRKIRESEERYRIVAETANDVIITIDEHSSILFVNSAMEKTLGYKPAELIGESLSTIVPERLRAAHSYGMNRYMQTGRKSISWSGLELQALHRDGSEIQVEISFSEYHENNKRLFTAVIRNITERRQAQQLILESEQKYRSIVETANEGIWLTDTETRTTYVNRQMAEMLGYTVDEMLGRIIFDFIFDEDLPAAKHKLEQRLLGESEIGEFRMRRKDGSEIITLYNTTPRRNQAGEIIGFLSMRSDITERKKAEASVNFQANLLNVVKQAVIATDENGIVTYWNQFAEKLYGWTNAEAVGRDIRELTTPETDVEQANQIMAQLSAGKSWTGEFLVRNKSGSNFPAYINNSPVNDAAGRLIGIVGVSVDITESKKAERELQNAEAKYRSLVESTPAIVYLNKPYPPYSTVYVSPNVKTFGYSPEEWYAESGMWVNMLYEEDREHVLREFNSATRHDLETDLEYRIVARDGKIHWWKDKGCFVKDEEGNKIGWQGVILDVTKTKELEEQLRQSQKLESVGRLAGGIAHDFNNMLTAINGYSELTLRSLEAGHPLRENIEEIKKAGERSAQLTHQLLAFSRQQVLQPVVLNLNEVITDTIKLLERVIGEDVKLVIALNPKTGRVNVDPGQLSQIIMNLAVNARDAMPHGGKLRIETANVFFEPESMDQKVGILPGAYVVLSVCDTGQGIEDKIQQQIFEPFFTTKELGKGTGLGLATVYGIVKQSGGHIEVDSQLGVGTTFKIYLPQVAEQSETVEMTDVAADFLTGTETILLVEDEELVRKLSKKMLETCGYTVIEAGDGSEALKIWEAGDRKPDLLITDVVMPQMGGRELAEKLTEKLPNIKILFSSGYAADAMKRHDFIETNFIQKPFTFDALNRQVRKLLDAEDITQ